MGEACSDVTIALLQGALGSVSAVCNGVSPIMYSVLLTAAQSTRFPGAPYALGGAVVLALGRQRLAKTMKFCNPIDKVFGLCVRFEYWAKEL
jgi:hypothetical protein